VKFSGGSDHEILSDPSVGIPTPSLTNWPDKYYHTSEDTIEKVNTDTLWNVGVVATTFAYTLANLDRSDFNLQAILTQRYCEEKIEHIYDQIIFAVSNSSKSEFNKKVGQQMGRWSINKEFWNIWLTQAIFDLKRFDECGDLERMVSFFGNKFRAFIDVKHSLLEDYITEQGKILGVARVVRKKKTANELEHKASKMFPLRIKPGPIDIKSRVYLLSEKEKKKLNELDKGPRSRLLPKLALYWADGKRSINEIAEKIELEMDRCNIQCLIDWFLIFEKMEFVRIQSTLNLKDSLGKKVIGT
jgi:hypothetical protein